MITQHELKELVEYDPLTGVFTNRVSRGAGKAGSVAGYITDGGYRHMAIQKKQYKAHRLAFLYMTGGMPRDQIDHINGVREDNRWENLREATNSENAKNRQQQTTNTSGVTGVHWHIREGKWVARIGIKGRGQKHLGSFEDFDEAVAVRKAAEVEHNYHENHGRSI